jgi:hypothetical protein
MKRLLQSLDLFGILVSLFDLLFVRLILFKISF